MSGDGEGNPGWQLITSTSGKGPSRQEPDLERKTRGHGQQPEGSPSAPTHSPSRTFSSLWPTYMLMSSGPFTLREVIGEGETPQDAETHN